MIQDFEEKFRNTLAALEKVGKEYAEARALSWLLQEQRKVVLSEAMRKSEGTSVADRETIARTSEEYKLHLQGTKDAIGEELKLKAKYERLYATYECLRSLCSQQTAQAKIV